MIPLVDAHCHIDLYSSPADVVVWVESNKVYTIAVTNAPSVFSHTAKLVENSNYIRPALGLHPQLVHLKKHELSLFRDLLKDTRYVGEVGLDYSAKQREDERNQREVFSSILDMCTEYENKILTVHSRHAAGDVISAIGDKFHGTVILHWFTGSLKELDRALSYGMFFSVNTSMVKTKKGQSLISRIPQDRIITETDGPFTKIANRISQPSDVSFTIIELAKAWRVEAEVAKEQVYSNFKQLLLR
ncbi:TatD family hydrolase [Paenibacillus sp. GYB004]|uniref:Qat anti-phage system TatD family nuclease QatD n=1 Tax=Paenibacillus sp. GYB004 TaxID=2994393 RepID=UPI002F96E74F